jgi:hypothetical protein
MPKKVVFGALVALLLMAALRNLNAAFARGEVGSIVWSSATAGALFVAAAVVWFASARAGQEVKPQLLATTLFCLLGAGYVVHLAAVPGLRFGAAATSAAGPNAAFEENYRARGKHTYHTNSLGFREPDWSLARSPASVRGVLIGDSMVFGSGVDNADTIDAALARRLRRLHPSTTIEILNLGVPGSNLPNYVELYRAAQQLLAPDFVVLFLLLPNDLSELEQPSLEGRVGIYSFLEFLLGNNNNPYTFYAMKWSEARSEQSQLEFLARHIDAIEHVRRSPLFVFLYRDDDPRWIETVRAHLGDGAVLVEHGPLPDTDFIVNDGHPTPQGNRHFAEIIGAALDRSALVSQLFGH